MKSLKLFFITALAAVALLTSCLDGDNISSGYDYGVVKYTSGCPLLYITGSPLPLYSSQFMTADDGDCYFVQFEIDFDEEPNANANKTGYYIPTLTSITPIDKGSTRSFSMDTTNFEFLTSELAPVDLEIQAFQYQQDYLFLAAAIEKLGTGQVNDYIIYYDLDWEPVLENGVNVYEVFLRVTKRSEGKETSSTGVEYNAFNMSSFCSQIELLETGKGNKNSGFKLIYINQFNTDSTGVAKWGETKYVPLEFEDNSQN
ncbi:MAG: hypothetical protein LIO97_11050 [Tannerellaceae bacterium]|nr:hypothetical protein [Tannerellaceae bacterium]